MSDHPIPPAIWERLITFLAEGRTGQVELNIHEGRVRDAQVRERVRAGDPVTDRKPVLDSEPI